jgi:hypothetical protein
MRVFENGVLRRVFESKWDDVIGEWRKLHIKELCNLYPLSGIIRIISSRMRWPGHVERMREAECI